MRARKKNHLKSILEKLLLSVHQRSGSALVKNSNSRSALNQCGSVTLIFKISLVLNLSLNTEKRNSFVVHNRNNLPSSL